jgi:hypothetical protein
MLCRQKKFFGKSFEKVLTSRNTHVRMSHTQTKGARTTADSKAHAEWLKGNTTVLSIRLNHHTDADILDRLETVESKQGYIKKAIRAYMAKEDKPQR